MSIQTNPDLRRSVIYELYVRSHTPQGTFRAVEPDLPRIRALGTDILWLMPIHPIGQENRKGSMGCPYANRDYRTVNPEYGTLEDFLHLVDAIHDNGTVAETGPNLAVIDCGGVGYACATTNYTLSQLKKGERAKLYTYLHVREEIFELYGFSSQAELNSFKMLIGVSGVGPKAALAVLSSTSPQNLALSIVTGDEKALTAAPGIGKKIAQRIILELKDKLAKDQSSFSAQSSGAIPVCFSPYH